MNDFGAEWAAVERHTERRILVAPYAAGQQAGSAMLVRGSSPTDHDYDGGPDTRSANIRVINRRHARLDCRPLCSLEKMGRNKEGDDRNVWT
jgi:hypothetical protein